MTHTGVFATEDEIKSLKALVGAPYILVGGMPPRSPAQECHRMALVHGLPEIQGYYGITNEGEFVSTP